MNKLKFAPTKKLFRLKKIIAKNKFANGPTIKIKNFFHAIVKLKFLITAFAPIKLKIIFSICSPKNFATKTCESS